jgi:hypothetical protein
LCGLEYQWFISFCEACRVHMKFVEDEVTSSSSTYMVRRTCMFVEDEVTSSSRAGFASMIWIFRFCSASVGGFGGMWAPIFAEGRRGAGNDEYCALRTIAFGGYPVTHTPAYEKRQVGKDIYSQGSNFCALSWADACSKPSNEDIVPTPIIF